MSRWRSSNVDEMVLAAFVEKGPRLPKEEAHWRVLSVVGFAVVCNVEHHVGDCGVFARASGDYAIVISHNLDNGTWTGTLPTEVWPPWLVDVSDISSNFMNWLT